MKSREEILAKAEELKNFDGNEVQEETYFMLLDIAGDSDADMFSEAGIHDMLYSMSKHEGTVTAQAADIVAKFLKV
jgi:hypothetical protein